MKIFFDRFTFFIFFGVLLVTIIAVFILKSIHHPITIDVTIHCEHVNFRIKKTGNPKAFNLLNSHLWIGASKIQEFSKIRFKVSPSIQNTTLKDYCDNGYINIIPESNSASVSCSCPSTYFSLNQVHFDSVLHISWSIDSSFHKVILSDLSKNPDAEIISEYSIGDTLTLVLYNCAFVNSSEKIVHKTTPNNPDTLNVPVSFASPFLFAHSQFKRLVFTLEDEIVSEDIEIIKDIQIQELDFIQQERDATGVLVDRNKLVNGYLKRAQYKRNDSIPIPKKNYITYFPDNVQLKNLIIEPSVLTLNLEFLNVKSFKFGPRSDSQHEMVKSRLERLVKNETLIIIYSIVIVLFGFLTRIILKKKISE